MIPIVLILAIFGGFVRNQPSALNTFAWLGALIIGVFVNPFLWIAAIDAAVGRGCLPLCVTALNAGIGGGDL
jgi:hypothetical protein